MGDGGYRAQSGTMWWRMYSGHNCVNYAAYRMIKAGLPNVRPWTGSGNATNWGPANPKIRDNVPTVGAIAWWSAYHPPAGASGHVAYVEKVVSDSEIIVSQDSWGGDFSWARITRTSGRWPTGFLHFKDAAVLTNTAAPTVSGTPRVASTLTATGASWTPAGASITYQWRADGANIPDATSSTLVLGLAQLGKQISVVATAQSPGVPSSSVESARTAPVEAGQIANSVAPSIVGEPRVDSTLTATPGSWTPTPTTLAYRWFANGRRIRGRDHAHPHARAASSWARTSRSASSPASRGTTRCGPGSGPPRWLPARSRCSSRPPSPGRRCPARPCPSTRGATPRPPPTSSRSRGCATVSRSPAPPGRRTPSPRPTWGRA